MSEQKTVLVWCDLETTGLDTSGRILEIAIVLTDQDMNEIASYESAVPQDVTLAQSLMNEYVKTMHEDNGLIKALRDDVQEDYDFSIAKIEETAMKVLDGVDADDIIFVIAGSTISFDRIWLKDHMPTLEGRLHYRQLDVSSYKVGFPTVFPPDTSDAHRAMPDIRASMESHRKMRRLVLTGQDSLTARSATVPQTKPTFDEHDCC